MIILRPGRGPRKPPVGFRQILPLQVRIDLRVRPDLLTAQLLDQPILMRTGIGVIPPRKRTTVKLKKYTVTEALSHASSAG